MPPCLVQRPDDREANAAAVSVPPTLRVVSTLSAVGAPGAELPHAAFERSAEGFAPPPSIPTLAAQRRALPSGSMTRILHIEDSRSDCMIVAITLADTLRGAWQLTQVSRLDQALERLNGTRFDVILLDLALPDCQGDAALATIGAAAPNTPIVILTGSDDEAFCAALVRVGADDVLSKKRLSGAQLARAIRHSIARRQAVELRQRLTLYDDLTRLPNRHLFIEHAVDLIEIFQPDRRFLLLSIALEGVDLAERALGDAAADDLVRQVAKRLRDELPPSDTLAHVGERKFAALVPACRDRSDAIGLAHRLLGALSRGFSLLGERVFVRAAIGIATFPENGRTVEALLQTAESALRHITQTAKEGYSLACPDADSNRATEIARSGVRGCASISSPS